MAMVQPVMSNALNGSPKWREPFDGRLISAVGIVLLASAVWGAEWSQFQSKAQKCGIATQEEVTRLLPRFKLGLWSDANGETVFTASSAALDSATIYIGRWRRK